MFIEAKFHGAASCPGLLNPNHQTRGTRGHLLNLRDLVEFGRSPIRWREWLREPDARPWNWQDALRAAVLVPDQFGSQYVVRPSTYPALLNTCPRCGSTSAAAVCRRCGQRRILQSTERTWAGTADYCRKWTEAQNHAGKFILNDGEGRRVHDARDCLTADAPFQELLRQSQRWQSLSAVWQDADTGLKITILERVHLVPDVDSKFGGCLGGIYTTRDAAPGPWETQAVRGRLHVKAAWLLDLATLALGSPVTRMLWTLVEPESPHVVARRSPRPELIQAGREVYQQLLGAYAKCLKVGGWPSFEPNEGDAESAWAPMEYGQWIRDADNASSAMFALQAASRLKAA